MAENSNRLAEFKSLGHKQNAESLRQRRHEVTVELRKSKKDDQLFKRRNIHTDDDTGSPASPLQENNGQATILNLPEIMDGLMSKVASQNFSAVQTVRRMLSRERNPPIDIVIQAGVIPYCVNFLNYDEHPELQFEAAWALTNIASGNSDQTKAVLRANAVPKFIELLSSPVVKVAEQAVWALGNISGDGPEMRDYVLSFNIVDSLLKLDPDQMVNSFLRNVVWLSSNLCRSKNPHPPFDKIRPLIPVMVRLLHHADEQIVTDACWAISYITDDESEKIQAVLDAGAAPELAQLLDSASIPILTPALRSVGNIVTGTDPQTDAMLETGVLQRLHRLLNHKKPNIVKEAAWAISNIVAGTPEQIGQVLASDVMSSMITVLESGDFKSQKEAAWVITNITTGGTQSQIIHLIETFPVLKPYCDLMDAHDSNIIIIVLKGLENLFKLGDKMGGTQGLCLLIEEIGALDKLEGLQSHQNEEIYKQAFSLVSTYFSDENDDAEVGPAQHESEFQFNSPATQDRGNFNF